MNYFISQVLQVFLAEKQREPHEIASELKRLQMSRGFDDSAKIKILLEALIDIKDPKTISKQFENHAEVFSRFCVSDVSAKTLLDRIEEFVGITHPELLPRTPMILQALGDVVSDEAVLEWVSAFGRLVRHLASIRVWPPTSHTFCLRSSGWICS